MMNYKYHLLKYKGLSSRLTCPKCGRKHCFVPYVDEQERIVSEVYGRCNHESSCGYQQYPPSDPHREYHHLNRYAQKHPSLPQKKETTHKICTIPEDIMDSTVRTNFHSHLFQYLSTFIDPMVLEGVILEYRIGVTKSRDTIYYQIDSENRIRTGKIMKYDPDTGHRIKDENITNSIMWVHSLLKQQGVLPQNWELRQCLFGEHLLKVYPDKPVCLVEAEKTAIIGAALCPDFIWVAVGGKTQLGNKVEVLRGREIVAFPDTDGYEKWKEKATERPNLNIFVSDYLEKRATPEQKASGADIADILIDIYKTTTPDNTNLHISEEVRKYFQPKYHKEMQALIDDLELELVTVKEY